MKIFFIIKNRFEINNHTLNKNGTFIKRQDAESFNELKRIYACVDQIITRFVFDVEICVERYVDSDNEFSPYLSNNRIRSYVINVEVYNDTGVLDKCSGRIIFNNIGDRGRKKDNIEPHTLSWYKIPYLSKRGKDGSSYGTFHGKYKCACTFNGLAISNIFAYEMETYVKNVIPNILAITRIISNQYNGINYIAPLRNNPERVYLINRNVSSVGITGENAPILLAKYKSKPIKTDMYCPWTNTKPIDSNGCITAKFEEVVQQWLTYFELGNLKVKGDRNGTVSLNLNQQNIMDVGFGASQVLPIIIQGIFMDKEQTFLIEQPEIHLHPKMELQMADFLIALAKTGRNIIIETHSDHIINRIIHRTMEDYSLNDMIKIYFVENTEEHGSIVHESIEIDKYKGTKDEYANFFTQYTTETSEIMKIGLENMLGAK